MAWNTGASGPPRAAAPRLKCPNFGSGTLLQLTAAKWSGAGRSGSPPPILKPAGFRLLRSLYLDVFRLFIAAGKTLIGISLICSVSSVSCPSDFIAPHLTPTTTPLPPSPPGPVSVPGCASCFRSLSFVEVLLYSRSSKQKESEKRHAQCPLALQGGNPGNHRSLPAQVSTEV